AARPAQRLLRPRGAGTGLPSRWAARPSGRGVAQLDALLAAHPELRPLGDEVVGLHGSLAWRRGDTAEGERLLRQAIAGLRQHHHHLDTIPHLYELRDFYQRQERVER